MMYILAGIVGVIALGLMIWFGVQHIGNTPQGGAIIGLGGSEEDASMHSDCEHYHPLTGECRESTEDVPVVAVMVENHIDAQPLSGVADASIVYEAPVEGSIPRLLAIYPVSSTVAQVGPVRSARPYYLQWVSEYPHAMYMHVGGSPAALEQINEFALFDLNEFSRGWYYWRGQHRFAPHNVYTSSDMWQAAYNRYAASSSDYSLDSWRFGSKEACEQNCVESVSLSYGGGAYNPVWRYNSEQEHFERYQFNRRHRDADGTPYIADTVLIMNVTAEVLDNVGRLGIDVQGSGEGMVLRNGHAIPATWQKDDRTERTRWLGDDGEEIALRPGKIWVQVVSQFNGMEIELTESNDE